MQRGSECHPRDPDRPRRDDWWCWELDPSGWFSVKSAYKAAFQFRFDDDLSSNIQEVPWKKLWGLKPGRTSPNALTTFRDWLIYVMNNLKPELIEEIATILYHLWLNRNDKLHGRSGKPTPLVYRMVKRSRLQYSEALKRTEGDLMREPMVRQAKWYPPQ
ncbi:hypothetical protein Droror1_Dr00006296 [Drosera rotundifolia]